MCRVGGGGGIKSLFAPIHDPRDPKRIRFPLPALCFVALLMYLCGLRARRCIKGSLQVPLVDLKLKALGAPALPHGDSINDLFKLLDVDEVQEVVSGSLERLIRSRSLERYRLLGSDYLIAVDGTWTLAFKEPHADNCLTQTHDEKTTYYYMVLEAKLVTPNGLALSLMSEFIENAEPNASKQDCETKAFLRLVKRIKQRFPRLPITLLLDGMFAIGPVFHVCQKYNWHYLTTLKDKDLPSVIEEVNALTPLQPENRVTHRFVEGSNSVRQDISWVTDITYLDTQKRQHAVSVITCTETVTSASRRPRRIKRVRMPDGTTAPPEPTTNTKTYRWITNHSVTSKTILDLATTARRRWKIEEGFNEQKNLGDLNLKHAYTYDPNAVKVFYLLLQLAHLLLQLMYKTRLFDRTGPSFAGSMREFAKNMREAWRNLWRIEGLFDPPPRFQLRLCPQADTA